MPLDAIIGLQWGDEGKGKITDRLAKNYDLILRFQGGNNAGHTVYFQDKKVVLHQVPSGILQPHTRCLIGPGVVLDPEVLQKELKALDDLGIVYHGRLFISARTSIIMPYHQQLDQMCCGKIGTTGRGIGPAYEDLIGRRAIRIIDIVTKSRDELIDLIASILPDKTAITMSHGELLPFDPRKLADHLLKFKKLFEELVIFDFTNYLVDALEHGKNILAEGAQGALLDIINGTYRYNTSSIVTIGGLFGYTGIPPQYLRKVYGVFKAYITRVGNGPFPTELTNGIGEQLRQAGQEFGSTTGRPRRCGWLDLPLLRYACRINGVTDLIMTKADVMSVLEEYFINNSYACPGNKNTAVFSPEFAESLVANNEIWLPGFQNIRDKNFQLYLDTISQEVMPISLISHGPGRDEIVEI